MFEIELAKKMYISLDDVYKLSAQFPQLFDGFEAVYQEMIDEHEEELRQQAEETKANDAHREALLFTLETENSDLIEENHRLCGKIVLLEDMVEELGGSVE